MKLIDFIVKLGDTAIEEPNKYFIPGHNGPYNDPETPVRNKGHWLITLGWDFQVTGDSKFKNITKSLAGDLFNHESRTHGYSFYHRFSKGRDNCNGLIGQAWTLESLAYASLITEDPKYVELAEEVFFQHTFNSECGLWNRLEIDGTILSIDPTFNHQLWFAACASLLKGKKHQEINERVICFLNFLDENLTILDNGLIYHSIENQLIGKQFDSLDKLYLKETTKRLLHSLGFGKWKINETRRQFKERMIYKSIGYHQFNMYAFAMLKESVPDHPFWKSPEFKRLVDFLVSDEFKNRISDNIYGYPYNPPGFEVPFALSLLTDLAKDELVHLCSWWVNEQFKRCYNPETRMMDRNTGDPLTHTARVYELARLPISILKRIEVDI